jgi:hypothetical protein
VLYNTKSEAEDQVEQPKAVKSKKPGVTKKKGAQGRNNKKMKQEVKEEAVKKEGKSGIKVCHTT